jgi:hypothetical protein
VIGKARWLFVRIGKVCGIATWLGRYGATTNHWNHAHLWARRTYDYMRSLLVYCPIFFPFSHSFLWLAIAAAINMFVLKTLSVAVAVAIFAVAHPTSHLDFEKSVAETLKAAPAGWVQDSSEDVDKDATSITLKIHLVNKDMAKFHERAMNVSVYSSRIDVELLLTSCTGRDTWSCFVRPAHVS